MLTYACGCVHAYECIILYVPLCVYAYVHSLADWTQVCTGQSSDRFWVQTKKKGFHPTMTQDLSEE
jgi:hypothetical protein